MAAMVMTAHGLWKRPTAGEFMGTVRRSIAPTAAVFRSGVEVVVGASPIDLDVASAIARVAGLRIERDSAALFVSGFAV